LDRAGDGNAEWKKEVRIPNSTFRIPNWVTPDRPASKLRNADCGMRIEKENPKNPKSEIRNPKYLGRCFLRLTPLLPGHKLAFSQKRKAKSERGKTIPIFPASL
jgi:hypothetical protein